MYLHGLLSTSPPLFRLCIQESSVLRIARFLQMHADERYCAQMNMTHFDIDEILEEVRLTQQIRVTLYSIGNLTTVRIRYTKLNCGEEYTFALSISCLFAWS